MTGARWLALEHKERRTLINLVDRAVAEGFARERTELWLSRNLDAGLALGTIIARMWHTLYGLGMREAREATKAREQQRRDRAHAYHTGSPEVRAAMDAGEYPIPAPTAETRDALDRAEFAAALDRGME